MVSGSAVLLQTIEFIEICKLEGSKSLEMIRLFTVNCVSILVHSNIERYSATEIPFKDIVLGILWALEEFPLLVC